MTSDAQCSVIIISYNNFAETTGPCLQSLRASSDTKIIEIIVVDNNSDETTCQNLKEAAGVDPRIKLIFNKTNSGYAGGNNIGARAATSPLLLLLNSDTEVLPDSIPCLIRLMDKHPDWAMLGPISNQTGNDQQIHTKTKNPTVEDIMAEGLLWCQHKSGRHYTTDILSFCCVMIRKTVYDQLNGLDEEFGLGYYEDTDFNYRAVNAGLSLMITEDTFIYHRGSGSFAKTSKDVARMVKKNKQLFRKKHGHGIIAAHWRIKNLEALQRYISASGQETNRSGINYAFNNRYALGQELIPNSPLKKFLYFRKLKQIYKLFHAA